MISRCLLKRHRQLMLFLVTQNIHKLTPRTLISAAVTTVTVTTRVSWAKTTQTRRKPSSKRKSANSLNQILQCDPQLNSVHQNTHSRTYNKTEMHEPWSTKWVVVITMRRKSYGTHIVTIAMNSVLIKTYIVQNACSKMNMPEFVELKN